ncbi:MAG: hypothetical protein KDA98_13890, partial [Acidimicrobiales bacterium]|nr:hypothetical protein [Acidimicrobiales bacterium]
MPAPSADLATRRRRRQRHMLAAAVASVAAWTGLTGLPFAAAAPAPVAGAMDTEIVTLSGPDGEATAAASSDAAASAEGDALRSAP